MMMINAVSYIDCCISLVLFVSRTEGIIYGGTYHHGVELYDVMLNCVCLPGMSGGPVLSRRGVVGMVDSGGLVDDVDDVYTKAVDPDTILEVLKAYLYSTIDVRCSPAHK